MADDLAALADRLDAIATAITVRNPSQDAITVAMVGLMEAAAALRAAQPVLDAGHHWLVQRHHEGPNGEASQRLAAALKGVAGAASEPPA